MKIHNEKEKIKVKIDYMQCIQAIEVIRFGFEKKHKEVFEKGIDILIKAIDESALRKD